MMDRCWLPTQPEASRWPAASRLWLKPAKRRWGGWWRARGMRFNGPCTTPPKEDPGDPRFLAYRASRLLAVGRFDEAGADIQQALKLDPGYSEAHGLQAIIFVVQNERENALESAQKAVKTGPTSATAHIALSYAQQAGFDLEGARASVEKAVNLDAFNALAWARLAELWASFGRLGKSLEAAKKAVEINPDLSRTQMVLGFAYLTQVKTAESRAAFEKAIKLDEADPLSRLGLGLAIIRDGDLDAGGREIEIAASLDPNNSIIRSYLGKTYFEKKQTGLDEREYAIAKELDPNDPTPWFYSAIAKQTTNRPVEALHDFQKAIELNDNRKVYRSRLLLDSDEAARSAATARVYSDLGFQQLALVEGYKSVNTDPTNHSAHRFLADSYAVRPRHEIARVSELLQSQLLQPTNITPIQPRLAESNLLLLSAQGPASLSFNEFNPIFNRNRIAFQGSGLAGENDTYGGEGVVSGIYKKFSFSGGYTRFDTDGWRDNADQEDKIANIFAQYELSYKTSIQAEYRYRDTEYGDTVLKFNDSSFFPNVTNKEETNTFRLGARHSFSPGSILLASGTYQDADFRETQDPFPQAGVDFLDFNAPDTESYGGELQHLFRSQHFNLVTGVGYFDVDQEVEQTFIFSPPIAPPGTVVSDKSIADLQHANAYAYSYINALKNTTITVGASYDNADSDFLDDDRNQFNPKLGIVWNPFPSTTLRAAAFRTLRRVLTTQQTLEPTQVAGFNQFFDDLNLTKTWNYGAAIDQKFSSSIYGGLEFTYRDLDVPFLQFVGPVASNEESEWEEYIGRAYLFWTPHEWLSLRAEYIYERLEREEPFIAGVKESDTHKVPLGISFFHPSGLSASLTTTYYNQDGTFGGFYTTDPIVDGDEDFVLVDAAINYRLPKRYGFITVGAKNLFDEDFNFSESDLNNASIQPDRTIFATITLSLP
jgi:Tfp pilus assembly protein PilF